MKKIDFEAICMLIAIIIFGCGIFFNSILLFILGFCGIIVVSFWDSFPRWVKDNGNSEIE